MRLILNNKYLVLIFFIIFASCSNDNEDSLDQFTVSLATVNPISDKKDSYYLTLDDGSTIWPSMSSISYSAKANQRVIINYTPLANESMGYDHSVKINSLQEILTAQIISINNDNAEIIGDEPIKILDLWIGDNYLNIHFMINVGGNKSHLINLIKINESEGSIEMELRHNINGDEPKYSIKNYAAFDLKPLQKEGLEIIKLIVKAKDYNNTVKEHTVVYNYKKENL